MVFEYFPQVTTTPTATPTANPEGVISLSLTSAVLAFVAFSACVICILLVVSWGRKLEKQAFQRESIVEALAIREANLHKSELYNRIRWEPIDPLNFPLPDEAAGYGVQYFWQNKPFVLNYDPTRPENYDYSDADKIAMTKLKEWGIAEEKRIEAKKLEIEKEAKERARQTIPESMDKSLLGGGFTFILEFSTVIVIIFSVVILGIIGILQSQEIATILAAIAGYVLGKATGFLPSSKDQSGQKIDDLSKKIEEQGKQIAEYRKQIEEPRKTGNVPSQTPPEDQSGKIKELAKQIKDQEELIKKQKKALEELKTTSQSQPAAGEKIAPSKPKEEKSGTESEEGPPAKPKKQKEKKKTPT